jgi:hypothetical protein
MEGSPLSTDKDAISETRSVLRLKSSFTSPSDAVYALATLVSLAGLLRGYPRVSKSVDEDW